MFAPICHTEVFMPFIALLIGALIAVADQIIKYFISANLKPSGSVDVIDGIFKLVYTENRGVAFGMFSNMRWLFILITVLLIGAIIAHMFIKRPKGKFFYVTAGMIIGGGIGNLIDRITLGYVVDYLSLSFFPPICNFADYCITIGAVLLAVYLIFFSDSKKLKSGDSKNA